MVRRTIRGGAFVFPVLIAVPVALAAPALRERAPGPTYAPTTVGDRLVYERFGTEVSETVTRVDEDGPARVLTIEGKSAGRESYAPPSLRVAPDGVFSIGEAGPYAPPRCLLRLPAVTGSKWEYVGAAGKGTSVVAGEEEVEVPAGKYKAVRVDSEHTGPDGRPVRVTVWYAAGVGMIRADCGADRTIVLKSFTPGKKVARPAAEPVIPPDRGGGK